MKFVPMCSSRCGMLCSLWLHERPGAAAISSWAAKVQAPGLGSHKDFHGLRWSGPVFAPCWTLIHVFGRLPAGGAGGAGAGGAAGGSFHSSSWHSSGGSFHSGGSYHTHVIHHYHWEHWASLVPRLHIYIYIYIYIIYIYILYVVYNYRIMIFNIYDAFCCTRSSFCVPICWR